MAQRDTFQRSQALIFTSSSKPKKGVLQQNGVPQKTSKNRQKGVAFLRMLHLKHRNATLFYRNATPFLKKKHYICTMIEILETIPRIDFISGIDIHHAVKPLVFPGVSITISK